MKASLNRARGLVRDKNGYCEFKLVSVNRVKFAKCIGEYISKIFHDFSF